MVKYVTDFFIYRWRYALGYSVVGLILAELLVLAAIYIPGGLTNAEMTTAVISDGLSFQSFNPINVINLPYYMLQHLSFMLLGITTFSIKLPSLIFGFVSIIGMIILLRTWFRDNVAVLTTILVVTTGQFLFVAQSGTPSILYIFWSVWILVAATMVARGAAMSGVWKIILFGLASLSLYTPLSIYILIALVSAALLHPHLRYMIRKLPRAKLLLAGFCALLLVTPLIQAIIKDSSIGYMLLGIPKEMPNIAQSGGMLVSQYINFASPSSSLIMTPIYGLASMLIILLGFYRLFTTKYTARSYIISMWVILLIPILVINPMFVSITFVPVLLLMAMGITVLFSRWYRLFPFNPYARVAGLIPIVVLIASMVFTGVDRYGYGYHYDPQTATSFSKDLRLLGAVLPKYTDQPLHLVTTDEEVAFYSAFAKHKRDLSVSTTAPEPANNSSTVILTHDAKQRVTYGAPTEIVTNSFSNNADRFYIYKSEQK